jgi:hypothetical protein
MTSNYPSWYSDWSERTWQCHTCRWQGPGQDLAIQWFSGLGELYCPGCGEKFGRVEFPSEKETRAAAKAGNAEAIAHLKVEQAAEKFRKSLKQARTAPLPDLEGERLEFTFHTNGGRDSLTPFSLAVTCNGQEIYSEPTGYEGWYAILQISDMLLDRYAGRIAWIDPAEAGIALLGDDISAPGHIATYLREHKVTPPTGHWA